MNGKNANQPTKWRNPASACLRAEQYQKWAGKARVDPRDLTAIQVSWLAGKNTWLTINYTKNYFLSKYLKRLDISYLHIIVKLSPLSKK